MPTTNRPISSVQGFSLVSGQQSLPIKIPTGAEISVTIPTFGTASGGTITIDYTQSADSAVQSSPPTATWVSAYRTYTASIGGTSGVSAIKTGQDCWVRFNCTSGSGSVSVDPSGTTATEVGAPFDQVMMLGTDTPVGMSTQQLLGFKGYKGGSLAATPVAGPIGAFGVLSPTQVIMIPANTLMVGSRIEIDATGLKTGSGTTSVFAPYFGNVNSISSNAAANKALNSASITYFRCYGKITITSQTTWQGEFENDFVGVSAGNPTNVLATTNFDWTTPSYVTFGANPVVGGDTVALINYSVKVFP